MNKDNGTNYKNFKFPGFLSTINRINFENKNDTKIYNGKIDKTDKKVKTTSEK